MKIDAHDEAANDVQWAGLQKKGQYFNLENQEQRFSQKNRNVFINILQCRNRFIKNCLCKNYEFY